jgi:hypothetical protein
MPPHWCEKGHYGYLIEGQMEIEYENEKIIYNPGDGIFIPDGPEHKHKGEVLLKKPWVFSWKKFDKLRCAILQRFVVIL